MKALVDRSQEVEISGSKRGGRKRGKGVGGEKGVREALRGRSIRTSREWAQTSVVVIWCVVM